MSDKDNNFKFTTPEEFNEKTSQRGNSKTSV